MTARRAQAAGSAGRAAKLFAAWAGLAAAACAVAFFLFVHDGSYTIHARFENAGQLVKGGEVQVAGRQVGSISSIELSPEGQADVELSIGDDGVVPLHTGTRASIRAVGQAGVANRFVDLAPGSSRNPELDDGAVLPTSQTAGIVNLDALLNTFDPDTRADLQELIRRSDEVFAGSGATYYNGMLAKLDPALGEVGRLTGQLADDGARLRRLISTAETAATAVASRRPELRAALDDSARWLDALADQRDSVSDSLRRAPGVLRQARGTLSRAGAAVTELRPALRDVPAAAPPLRELLSRVNTTLPAATPVVAQLRGQLPDLRRALAGFPPLEPPMRAALRSTGGALRDAVPILRGLRLYAPDLFLGVINGLAGVAVGSYNSIGHYTRLEFVQPPQTFFGGQLANLLSTRPLIPGLFDQKIHQTRRCPGGALPPAPDGSNANIGGEPLCDPGQSMSESVNRP